jgi:acetoin utilization protein AcuB
MGGMLISDIMVKNLRTISPDATLSSAGDLMKQYKIRHLLIIDPVSGKLIGLLSDRDVKKIVSPFAGSRSATERDNATLQVKVAVIVRNEPIAVAKPSDTVRCVAEMLLQKKISAIPIVDEDRKAVGIVTSDDLVRLLLKFV